jgi:hypothetical protein
MFSRLCHLWHQQQKVAPMPLPEAIPVREAEIAAVLAQLAAVLAEVRLDLQHDDHTTLPLEITVVQATREDQDYTLMRQILIMDG